MKYGKMKTTDGREIRTLIPEGEADIAELNRMLAAGELDDQTPAMHGLRSPANRKRAERLAAERRLRPRPRLGKGVVKYDPDQPRSSGTREGAVTASKTGSTRSESGREATSTTPTTTEQSENPVDPRLLHDDFDKWEANLRKINGDEWVERHRHLLDEQRKYIESL